MIRATVSWGLLYNVSIYLPTAIDKLGTAMSAGTTAFTVRPSTNNSRPAAIPI